LTLTVLVSMAPEYFRDVFIYGVIKETGIDDDGLLEFIEQYFPYPVYRDPTFAYYHALGDRKVSPCQQFSWNPVALMHCLWVAIQRINEKKIEGNVSVC
jgi:hypothetical protein